MSPLSPLSPFKLAEDVPEADVTVRVVPFHECVQDTPSVPLSPLSPLLPVSPLAPVSPFSPLAP